MKKKGLLLFLPLLFFVGCTQASSFNGSSVGNEDEYRLSYEVLNTEKTNWLNLKQGDTVKVKVDNKKGSVAVKVTQEDETELLNQNYETAKEEFDLTIPEDGEYQVYVNGKNAKGEISLVKQ